MENKTLYNYHGKYREGRIDDRKPIQGGASGICRVEKWITADTIINDRIISVPVAIVTDIDSGLVFTVFPEQLELSKQDKADVRMIGKSVQCRAKLASGDIYEFGGIIRDKVRAENTDKNIVDVYLVSDSENEVFNVFPEAIIRIQNP